MFFSKNTANIFQLIVASLVSVFGGSVALVYADSPNTHYVAIRLAGANQEGFKDGLGKSASFARPDGLAVDERGYLYVADSENNKIRKVSPSGEVITLAGSGEMGDKNGTGRAASFSNPQDVAVNFHGDVYVADFGNIEIRKITAHGRVSTLAGSGNNIPFGGVGSLAVDTKGNVYFSDINNHKIWKISPSGLIAAFVGSGAIVDRNGPANIASFKSIAGLAVDHEGNLYAADLLGNKIRKITPSGMVSTLAGSGIAGDADGAGKLASFSKPDNIAVDAKGNIYVSEDGNNKIRKISPAGNVSTLVISGADSMICGGAGVPRLI
jgi:sugar lactone lactonase YvrE